MGRIGREDPPIEVMPDVEPADVPAPTREPEPVPV
jgi:hypothetical protein